MSPTKAEKSYWDRLVNEVGCIACLIDGNENHHVSIHHVFGRTKKGAHMNVLPLCEFHHQTGGESAPSLHPWRNRFAEKYGTEVELMAMCNKLLGLVLPE